jgi:hypothetical protein
MDILNSKAFSQIAVVLLEVKHVVGMTELMA